VSFFLDGKTQGARTRGTLPKSPNRTGGAIALKARAPY